MSVALCTKVDSTGSLVVRAVVGLSIQIQVGVSEHLVHHISKGAIWSSVYVNVQLGTMVFRLSLHGELDFGVDVIEVIKEVLQLFGP
jgi:hypothetical protein